ncbi:MAG TPA: GAF domain-containing protein, partial [Candidatus Acidoferrales bacterium]|nr:GAF domain-containing protein [Candidatus Acidoferrales bacterium]
ARRRPAGLRRTNAELQRHLDERTAELKLRTAEWDEALAREAATAEVLQVINSSPGDLAPVFDAILDKALHLCQAAFGALWTYDGEYMHAVATRNVPSPMVEFLRQGPHRPASVVQRALVDGAPYDQIADLRLTDGYRAGEPIPRAGADLAGVRTLLGVALRKNDKLLGIFGIYRQEVRPFTEKQIVLLQSFAAQAVIAMENARLITETREALEQQTATAEVLGVINSSPGDLAPVFDAILEKAHTLCGAVMGSLVVYDGEHFRALTTHGYPEEYAVVVRQPFPPSTFHRALIDGERHVHIPDTQAIEWKPGNEVFRTAVEAVGAQTSLLMPLRKDGKLLGLINAGRQEVRPFADKEIALLQNFAAQAVIAMENARLITETREALEQQTATAEVLQVINSSPGDLAPVFDAILEKGHRLCGGEYGALQLYDGETFRVVATRGYPEPVRDLMRQPYALEPNSVLRRLIEGSSLAEIPDVVEFHARTPNARSQAAIAVGIRRVLFLPLRKDSLLLGLITVGRREVRPFSEKQIGLLQNFGAQAVIAMENARPLGELRQRTDEVGE